MDKNKFTTDDLVGVVIGFLKEQKKEDNPYITKEGLSFLGGYCKANNTIDLIEQEKYNKLLKDFENLISKYETQQIELDIAKNKFNELLRKQNKKRWFRW